MARVETKKIDLDKNKIKDFFIGRTKRLDLDPITAVLYQDSRPELAKERDQKEKDFILSIINFHNKDIVLDIGCGIGRWAEVLKDDIGFYLGTDFVSEFIDYATNKFKSFSNIKFLCLSAEKTNRENIKVNNKFSRIIIAGLLIYLNDGELDKVIHNIKELSRKDTIIYIREPCGVKTRLTLDNIWSEELNQSYNAIYRTRKELVSRLKEILGDFSIEYEGDLYKDDKLNNRKDTKQQVIIVRIK